MAGAPPAARDHFRADLHAVAEARVGAVVESTRQRQAQAWRHWCLYCQDLNIDRYLTGVQGAVHILAVWALRIRRGDYNAAHNPVSSDTVAKYLSAISQEILRVVDPANRNPAIQQGGYAPALRELLRSYSRADPPGERVWPINITILRELWTMRRPPECQSWPRDRR